MTAKETPIKFVHLSYVFIVTSARYSQYDFVISSTDLKNAFIVRLSGCLKMHSPIPINY